jgi:hypothetical protein
MRPPSASCPAHLGDRSEHPTVATIRSNGARSGALEAVAKQHGDLAIASPGQQPPGLRYHIVQDVHGHHQALLANDLGHHRGVVARPRPDLQHARPRRQLQQLQQPGDQRRLGGGACRHPVQEPRPSAVSE